MNTLGFVLAATVSCFVSLPLLTTSLSHFPLEVSKESEHLRIIRVPFWLAHWKQYTDWHFCGLSY